MRRRLPVPKTKGDNSFLALVSGFTARLQVIVESR